MMFTVVIPTSLRELPVTSETNTSVPSSKMVASALMALLEGEI